MKTALSFDFAGAAVPVEIRDGNMRLVAHRSSSETVTVDRGTYVVTATTPGGDRIVKLVEATKPNVRVQLHSRTSPVSWRELKHYTMTRARALTDDVLGLESVAPFFAPPRSVLRAFSGNFFARERKPAMMTLQQQSRAGDTVTLTWRRPRKEVCFLQLVQLGRETVNIACPISTSGFHVVVHREHDRYWIEVKPNHEQANVLLGFTQNRILQQQAIVAEELLREKLRDPIGATIGAYALLRSGDLERLHDWTGNLEKWFLWLPDAAAIRGEHLARLGRHQEAMVSFLRVFERGLPLFSDGIRYMHDRLRTYRALEAPPNVGDAVTTLQRFMPYIDFDKALTTFTGLDPLKPDTKTSTRTPSGETLDLVRLFGEGK